MEQITSGVHIEEKTVLWKIEQFELICEQDLLLAGQRYAFTMGQPYFPTTWIVKLKNFYLKYPCARYSVDPYVCTGVQLMLKNLPHGQDSVTAIFSLKILRGMEAVVADVQTEIKIVPDNEVVELKIEKLSRDILPLVDGSLTLEITVKMYIPKFPRREDTKLEKKQEELEQNSIKSLSQKLMKGLNFHDTIVKIVAKDGTEFQVSKETLSLACPVLKKMLQESPNQDIMMDFATGKTIEVLLCYLFSGKLHPNWKTESVLEELVEAAHRYELEPLIKFLDEALGCMVEEENERKVRELGQKSIQMSVSDFFNQSSSACVVGDLQALLEHSLSK